MENNEKHLQTKLRLRKIGFTLLGLGLVSGIILIISFVGFAASGSPIFFLGFALGGFGGLLFPIGLFLTIFSYMGSIARFQATEIAPVAKDTFNYMAEGTQTGVKTFAKAISEGINEGKQAKTKCPNCNFEETNDAKFCSKCGKQLK